ncbi:50S ribosomal protein L3 [Candidatus Peregrinibacteria bacterium]|nr:50S ribosomal protein L3 [Candidatus Peregrinibacteria bacterium]
MPGIIGKKLGMSQVISDEGLMVPVTYVVCDPNTVFQVRTQEKDGYSAVVLGFEALKKPLKTKKFKTLKEFQFPSAELKVDDTIKVDIFNKDDLVVVTGVSKGKGFQGNVKRHHFKVIRRTHGTKYKRHGSTGQRAMPGRVFKGKRMPGRMGCDTVTLKKKQLLLVDPQRNVLAIKGSLPGAKNSILFIQK